MATRKLSRREMAQSIVSRAQPDTPTPLDELVNSLEFGEQAKRVLPDDVFAAIAGSDRSIFDRYTFRPRMNVPTLDMNLSVSLLGESLFTPLVVGPVSHQQRFHSEGERATLAGAYNAKTLAVVSDRASVPIAELAGIASEANRPLWVAVGADEDAPARAEAAAAAGAKVLFVTAPAGDGSALDWNVVEETRKAVTIPMVFKGVTTGTEALRAIDSGCNGLVVSNYGGLLGGSTSAPVPELQAIAEAAEGRLPVLVDGSFRRATDILVALILGARAVLIARPIMWALAAYGAEGVETLLRMQQRDLARCFAMLGASNLEALTRRHLKIHPR